MASAKTASEQSSDAPADLHSFPTRRSSDLDHGIDLRCRSYGTRTRRRLRATPGADGAQDRKSTRLNSSHVSISYAVFCLKKKNAISAVSGATEYDIER